MLNWELGFDDVSGEERETKARFALKMTTQKKMKWLIPSVFDFFGYQPLRINKCQQRVGRYDSHICTIQSSPSREVIGVSKPIITDVPVLLQFPPLLNSRNTALALLRGAVTHNGMIVAKKPTT